MLSLEQLLLAIDTPAHNEHCLHQRLLRHPPRRSRPTWSRCKLRDRLIVAVNDDASVSCPCGQAGRINSVDRRMAVLVQVWVRWTG